MNRLVKPVSAIAFAGCTLAAACKMNEDKKLLPPDTVTPVEVMAYSAKPWELICTKVKGRVIDIVPNYGADTARGSLINNDPKEPTKVVCGAYITSTGNQIKNATVKYSKPEEYSTKSLEVPRE